MGKALEAHLRSGLTAVGWVLVTAFPRLRHPRLVTAQRATELLTEDFYRRVADFPSGVSRYELAT